MFGIGGTFLSLLMNIQNAQSNFLSDDIKTLEFIKDFASAFSTSLIGITGSLMARAINTYAPLVAINEAEQKTERQHLYDILKFMQEQGSAAKSQAETLNVKIDNLQNTTAHISKQLDATNNAVNAVSNAITSEQNLLAQQHIELQGKIDSLKDAVVQVVDNTNKNIGDKIDSLKDAVVESIEEASKGEVKILTDIKAATEKIGASFTGAATDLVEKLHGTLAPILANLGKQALEQIGKSMADMQKQAQEAQKQMEETLHAQLIAALDELTKATQTQTQAMETQMADAIKEMTEAIDQQAEHFQNFNRTIAQDISALYGDLKQKASDQNAQMAKSVQDQDALMHDFQAAQATKIDALMQQLQQQLAAFQQSQIALQNQAQQLQQNVVNNLNNLQTSASTQIAQHQQQLQTQLSQQQTQLQNQLTQQIQSSLNTLIAPLNQHISTLADTVSEFDTELHARMQDMQNVLEKLDQWQKANKQTLESTSASFDKSIKLFDGLVGQHDANNQAVASFGDQMEKLQAQITNIIEQNSTTITNMGTQQNTVQQVAQTVTQLQALNSLLADIKKFYNIP